MRQKLDLRSGRVVIALGAVGLAGAAAAVALPASAGAVGSERYGASPEQLRAARRVVLTDSVGAAAAAVAPEPVGAEPVVSADESTRNFLVGGSVLVRGAVLPMIAVHRTVALEEDRGSRWVTVERVRTHRHGRYRLRLRPGAAGTIELRVLVTGAGTWVRHRLGTVNVYRQAFASWYSGGGALACGGTLTNSTLGVASKTLPCGTIVGLRLGRRAIRVPVVDRGPYVAGREFDLTPATKRALGFGDLGMIWVT
jgi:hypothetical protein